MESGRPRILEFCVYDTRKFDAISAQRRVPGHRNL